MPTNPDLAKYIRKRLAFLKDQRRPWEDEWDDLSNLIMPTRRFDSNYPENQNLSGLTTTVKCIWHLWMQGGAVL